MANNNNINNNNNNLYFFIEEQDVNNTTNEEIQKMLLEFNESDDDFSDFKKNYPNLSYYTYDDDDIENLKLFYEKEYKVKDLLRICEYYKIDKEIKSLKCKKQEIITAIIMFETMDENQKIVSNRRHMWELMEHLLADSYMRQYVIWN
jgi:hypothetical protein